MATINVNMYVPVTPPPAPAVPRWTDDGDFAHSSAISQSAQTLGLPSNTNLQNPYYVQSPYMSQDGSFRLYIPNNQTISQFYELGPNATWVLSNPSFTPGSQVTDPDGNVYNTYIYELPDPLSGYIAAQVTYSFQVT